MKAKYIKTLEGFNGVAKLYELSHPAYYNNGEETNYVIVSAVSNAWAHETYIFPADKNGNVLSWGELEGSERGTTSHEYVLANAGYEVEDDNNGAPGTSGYFSLRD